MDLTMVAEDKNRPTDKPARKGPDVRVIEIDKPGEVAFWTKWFNTTEDELRDAVRSVGPTAQSVALYFEELRRGGR